MNLDGNITTQFKIQRIEKYEDKKLVFGWAYMCENNAGEVLIDHSGEIVALSEIEKAAYRYVKFWLDGSDNHERGGVAVLVESMIFSPEKARALGIPAGILPSGWWVGFEVLDDDVWEKIKSGEYRMMSIEGSARRVPVPEKGDAI